MTASLLLTPKGLLFDIQYWQGQFCACLCHLTSHFGEFLKGSPSNSYRIIHLPSELDNYLGGYVQHLHFRLICTLGGGGNQ